MVLHGPRHVHANVSDVIAFLVTFLYCPQKQCNLSEPKGTSPQLPRGPEWCSGLPKQSWSMVRPYAAEQACSIP